MVNAEEDLFSEAKDSCAGLNSAGKDQQGKSPYDEDLTATRKSKYNTMALNPLLQPNITRYNIDNQCDQDTLFKSAEDKEAFHLYFK